MRTNFDSEVAELQFQSFGFKIFSPEISVPELQIQNFGSRASDPKFQSHSFEFRSSSSEHFEWPECRRASDRKLSDFSLARVAVHKFAALHSERRRVGKLQFDYLRLVCRLFAGCLKAIFGAHPHPVRPYAD